MSWQATPARAQSRLAPRVTVPCESHVLSHGWHHVSLCPVRVQNARNAELPEPASRAVLDDDADDVDFKETCPYFPAFFCMTNNDKKDVISHQTKSSQT